MCQTNRGFVRTWLDINNINNNNNVIIINENIVWLNTLAWCMDLYIYTWWWLVPEAFLTWFMAALCWSLFAWSTTTGGFVIRWTIDPSTSVVFHANYLSLIHSACVAPQRIDDSMWGYSGLYHTVATSSSAALVRAEPAIFLNVVRVTWRRLGFLFGSKSSLSVASQPRFMSDSSTTR